MSGSVSFTRKIVAEEAAEWIVSIDEGELSFADKRKLLDWLKQSPVHIEEFLLASVQWVELDGLKGAALEDIDKLIRQAHADVLALPRSRVESTLAKRTLSNRWKTPWRFALAATLLIGVGILFSKHWENNHFATDIGQQLTFTLSDGTVVHLNTASELTAEITAEKREIDLLRGEAMFSVAKDPARPFRVHSGSLVIQALGTRFNVYRQNRATSVTVVEGKVSVLAEQEAALPSAKTAAAVPVVKEESVYSAGQQAIGYLNGQIARVDKPDIEKSVAWRERRLVFRGENLASIAAEFNRYNWRKLEISGDEAKERTLTATFNADDPDSLVSFLERDPDIEVVRFEERILIQSK